MFQLCLAVSLAITWQAPQRPADEPIWTSTTIREALSRTGFDDGAIAGNAPDLDRRLTSSTFATTDDVFIAAYYFDDEVSDIVLGPLHVSRFDRPGHRWTHAPLFRGDRRGSALDVQIAASRVLVELHASPSAGDILVLDPRTLRVLTAIYGFHSRVMEDGSIRFIGSMVHFAPTHQEKLMVLDASDGRMIEVFPGTHRSILADEYRRTIRAAYAQVHESARPKYEQSGYGPIDDFDRSYIGIADRNGTRIAFVTVYACIRSSDGLTVLPMLTAVRCDRHARPEGRAYDGGVSARPEGRAYEGEMYLGRDVGPTFRSGVDTWSCNERPLDEAARELGVTVTTNPEGRYGEHAFDSLILALLKRSVRPLAIPSSRLKPDRPQLHAWPAASVWQHQPSPER